MQSVFKAPFKHLRHVAHRAQLDKSRLVTPSFQILRSFCDKPSIISDSKANQLTRDTPVAMIKKAERLRAEGGETVRAPLNEGSVKADHEVLNLVDKNRKWAKRITDKQPEFFKELAKGQAPTYLWIGCCDSRVPAEQILGVGPGEVFVYRNIANLVSSQDMGVHAALAYSIDHLNVKHILVCGHYGCGGVQAATEIHDRGLLEHWLQGIRQVIRSHSDELDAIEDPEKRGRRLVELNVIEQCINVYRSGIFQAARQRTAEDPNIGVPFPRIHPLVFDGSTGLVKKLRVDWPSVMAAIGEVYTLVESRISDGEAPNKL